MDLPTCPASAFHLDYAHYVFHCQLPLAHEGQHTQQVRPGVWMNWETTMGFDTAPPPNPGAPA